MVMTQTFTPNDVVRYLYHEVSDTESQGFACLLANDDQFRAMYREMLAAKRLVEQVNLQPGDRVVERILSYSRNYNILAV